MDLQYLQIFQFIALDLPDKGLVSLALTCRHLRSALEDRGFWRLRFADAFDKPAGVVKSANSDKTVITINWKRKYWERKKLLFTNTNLNDCTDKKNTAIFKMLKELIIEAVPQVNEFGERDCKNFVAIKDFVSRTCILRELFKERCDSHPAQKRVIYSTLICLAPLFFNIDHFDGSTVHGFPGSQAAAYNSAKDAPVLTGTGHMNVNMSW
jgi:hypothetical protein